MLIHPVAVAVAKPKFKELVRANAVNANVCGSIFGLHTFQANCRDIARGDIKSHLQVITLQ